jgi:hypothetical protein
MADGIGGLVLVATALTAAALSAYVPTVCPGTPGGDAGEMLQLAIDLGELKLR